MTYKNVIILDDNELFRVGLKHLINSFGEFKVVADIELYKFDSFIADRAFSNKTNLVLLCPPKSDVEGEITEKIVRYFQKSAVIVLSNHYNKGHIRKSIESGALAYFTRDISAENLCLVMRSLARDSKSVDIKMDVNVREVYLTNRLAHFSFSDSEKEILNLVCSQKSSAEISDELGVSVRTIESRKRSMMIKTNSKNIIGVILLYLQSEYKILQPLLTD